MEIPRFELKVNASHASELTMLVTSLASQFGVNVRSAVQESGLQSERMENEDRNARAEKVEAEKVEEKKPAKEKAKSTKEKTVVETTAETKSEKALTKEDIQDACQKVSETKNLDAAKAILSSFTSAEGKPCKRISDVQESDYTAFIKKCAE